jgi:hypothetical protein
MLEGDASEPARHDPALSEELEGLKEENGRLRKSLALLHAHSLRIQDQIDTLLSHGTESADAYEAVGAGMLENAGAVPYPRPATGQLVAPTYTAT